MGVGRRIERGFRGSNGQERVTSRVTGATSEIGTDALRPLVAPENSLRTEPLLARLASIKTRDLADRNISPGEAGDLLELVEAAMGAVLLTYDPAKTDAQNDEFQRRARRLNEALARFGWGPRAE